MLRLIKVPLTDGQFDALVSFTFNLGSGALQRSTLRRKVNREDGYYSSVEQYQHHDKEPVGVHLVFEHPQPVVGGRLLHQAQRGANVPCRADSGAEDCLMWHYYATSFQRRMRSAFFQMISAVAPLMGKCLISFCQASRNCTTVSLAVFSTRCSGSMALLDI